ncbi:MAG: hypothetical protein NVS3B2_02710 [Ramlibacter sp.]
MTAAPPMSSSMFARRFCALLPLALALASSVSRAQPAAPGLPSVTISAQGNRDPVEKSYRRMLRGMDWFEQHHAMAPAAQLRFRLLPRHRDTDLREIRVDVVGSSVETRVPVDTDGTFVLQRDRAAAEENAQVVPNRRRQSMTWRSEIRTPGLAPQTRRLGDLRLECEVGMEAGLVSNHRSLLDKLLGAIMDTPAYCHRSDPRYLFFSDQPLFGVTLIAGQRREALPVARLYGGASDEPAYRDELPYCDCEVLLDRTYFLPLGDASWPDETLVVFEPMVGGGSPGDLEAATIGGIVPGASTRADLALAFPKATVVRFDSGYEVWVDRDKPGRTDRRDAEVAERVILVDPSGLVTKTRVRLPTGQSR